jgi:hypothetical protein
MRTGLQTRFIVGAVLLLSLILLGSLIRPGLQAAGRTQYKVVTVSNAAQAQQILDQHAAEGWEFVGSIGSVGPPALVLKK